MWANRGGSGGSGGGERAKARVSEGEERSTDQERRSGSDEIGPNNTRTLKNPKQEK